VEGLEVRHDRMGQNVAAADGALSSERVLALLSARVGKHRAQDALQQVLATAATAGTSFADAVRASRLVGSEDLVAVLQDPSEPTASADCDRVVEAVRRFLDAEPDAWA
jgi:adenylosuccinate lyase